MQPQTPTSRECFTVEEFCSAHRVSRASFYNLVQRGLGPKTLRVGRRVLVSREAAEAWRRLMEAASTPRSGPSLVRPREGQSAG